MGDYLTFRQDAVEGGARSDMRSILILRDPQGRADSMITVLLRHGIEVGRLTRDEGVRATPYGQDDAVSVARAVLTGGSDRSRGG